MLPLTSSLAAWSAVRRRLANTLFVAVTLPVAAFAAHRIGHIFTQPDAAQYIALAEGRPAMLPFASRQLAPAIVRMLTHLPHVDLQHAFVIEGLAAFAVFLAVVAFLILHSGAPRFMLAASAGLVFWALQLNGLAMPDLLFAALLCGFLLLLRRGHLLAAACLLFPLTLSRESTLLVLVCFLLAGWRRLRFHEIAAALVSVLAGILVVKHLASNALPNTEHISPTLYLVAKMPWNFLKNLLGINLWANLYPSCGVPTAQIQIHVGPLRALGTCGFAPAIPIETYSFALAAFGLLPLLLLRVRPIRTLRAPGHARQDMLLRFALIYGGISFLLAPLLGESLTRLYGYSWPLFFVALPMLLRASRATFTSTPAALLFLALHLALSWYILAAYPVHLLEAAIVVYLAAFLLLRRTFRTGQSDPAFPDSAFHPLRSNPSS